MIRARLAAALGLLFAVVACTKSNTPPAGIRFRQPSSLAVFAGRTLADPITIKPYLVVANAAQNDLTVVDAVTDLPVPSPIKLRTLVIGVANRPSLLASASLGDGKSDLLVAVSGGDSVLQMVETWNEANIVHADPAESPAPLAVDLGYDVLALATMPSDPGTARLAVVLAERRVAIVTYVRGTDGESVAPGGAPTVSAPLPFQPQAIAAMPDDPDVAGIQTALYVASTDEVAPGVFGVAEISADLSTVRALGARGPTRLVAAARLRERFQPPVGAPAADLARSAASDGSAFDGQPRVPRVYAVLDESGCGLSRPIDCGIVVLDPDPGATQPIPADYAGLMPYRAPMHVPGRPLTIAASGPAARVVDPATVPGEPDYSGGTVPPSFMRLYMGSIARATTGMAAVASDDGNVYFLDLGRFELASSFPIVAVRGTGIPAAEYVTVTENDVQVSKRLWMQNPADNSFPENGLAAGPFITITPGFTRDEPWTVTYQGPIAPALVTRAGEAGEYTPGVPWIALQYDVGSGGTRILNEVVRLWHPDLAVQKGDILVIKALGMPAPNDPSKRACVGTRPPGTLPSTPDSEVEKEFELTIGDLVAPTAAYPGGAVTVLPPSATASSLWTDCYERLVDAASGTNVVAGLTVTVRAQGFVLTGTNVGYAGRSVPVVSGGVVVGQTFNLSYPLPPSTDNEDTLLAACPVASWTGALPAPACDDACRAACESLVLARKARRLQNVSVDCSTNPADTEACATGTTSNGTTTPARWPPATYPFPIVNGPALGFQVGVELKPGSPATATTDPVRNMTVTFQTSSGVSPLKAVGSSTAPYGATGTIAFDRSVWTDPVAGYRFLVSYPADFVLDTTPSQNPPAAVVLH